MSTKMSLYCHSILLKNEQKFAKIHKRPRAGKSEKGLKIKGFQGFRGNGEIITTMFPKLHRWVRLPSAAPKRNTTQQGGVSLWSAFGLLCRLPACGGLIQKQGKSGKVFPCKQFVPYGEWKRLHFFRQCLTNRTTARPGGSFAWSVLAFCMEKRRPVGRRFSVLEKLSFVAESVFGVWWTHRKC